MTWEVFWAGSPNRLDLFVLFCMTIVIVFWIVDAKN